MINSSVSGVLQEAYNEALEEANRQAAALEYAEVENPAGETILFDANQIICWYSAGQNKSVENISISHLLSLLKPHKKNLYTLTTKTEERNISYTETDEDGNPKTKTKRVMYTILSIQYSGNQIFPESIFRLDEEQIDYANSFAENLSMFLYDDSSAISMSIHKEIAEVSQGGGLPSFTGSFANPFSGQSWGISSHFGIRPYPGVGTGTNNHTGMDIPNALGTPIHAVADGVVLFVRDIGSRGYGKHVAIDHGNGIVTLYAHCSQILVTAGQEIAKVGSTGWSSGNHLHLEVIVNGIPTDPYPLVSNG